MRIVRKQKIYRTCRSLLSRYGYGKPPVDVERIAKDEGIKVGSAPLPERLAGFIHRRVDGSTVIVVKEGLSLYDKRWVMAHELGHYFLHGGEYHITPNKFLRRQTEESFSGLNLEEVEANQFADELLMPENMVHDLALARENIEIGRLANAFDVNQGRMAIRLGALGYLL